MSEELSQPNQMTHGSALLGTLHKAVLAAAGTTVGQGKQFDFCSSAAVLVQEPWELSGSAFCMKKIKFSRKPGVQLGSQHRVQCLGAAGPFAGAVRTLPHFSQAIFAGEINGCYFFSSVSSKKCPQRRSGTERWLVISSAALGQVRGNLGLPENC